MAVSVKEILPGRFLNFTTKIAYHSNYPIMNQQIGLYRHGTIAVLCPCEAAVDTKSGFLPISITPSL